MRPPLTTSMTVPVTGSPLSRRLSMRFQAFSNVARFLLRMRRPSASSFVHDERVDLFAELRPPRRCSTFLRMLSSLTGMTPSDL